MKAINYLLAITFAALVAGCGGGSEPEAVTPQAAIGALRTAASSMAAPSVESAADQLMDFAEQSDYSVFFPEHQTTLTFGPFRFRVYSTGVYLGVVVTDNPDYTLNGVYVLGGPFGVSPVPVGLLTNFITPVDVNPNPDPVTKNLKITVSGPGFPPTTFELGVTAFPTSQAEFCSSIDPGTIFNQTLAGSGFAGSLTIDTCSFSGNSGIVGATVAITSPVVASLPITISYTFE